jgi:hypothetical protein
MKTSWHVATAAEALGYILRPNFRVGWEILARRFNHSTPAVTRRYLGIQDDEVNSILVQCKGVPQDEKIDPGRSDEGFYTEYQRRMM